MRILYNSIKTSFIGEKTSRSEGMSRIFIEGASQLYNLPDINKCTARIITHVPKSKQPKIHQDEVVIPSHYPLPLLAPLPIPN